MASERRLEWDWYPGIIPDNVVIDETAYVETSYSFALCRSRREPAVVYGKGASTYLGTMFDLGPDAQARLGEFALVHGARIICDGDLFIGDHALISWNVLIMDSYRYPLDPDQRRALLRERSEHGAAVAELSGARNIHIGNNVWIGFDACILPGVVIGDGAVIGAKSVVFSDVPAYAVAAGNPARVIRMLSPEQGG
jgi:acetyltransferase-like isoleucine patch superfamily enzyme